MHVVWSPPARFEKGNMSTSMSRIRLMLDFDWSRLRLFELQVILRGGA